MEGKKGRRGEERERWVKRERGRERDGLEESMEREAERGEMRKEKDGFNRERGEREGVGELAFLS